MYCKKYYLSVFLTRDNIKGNKINSKKYNLRKNNDIYIYI